MAVRATATNPHVIRWARERAGLSVLELLDRFPHLPEWENGEKIPTLKQLELFARATHIPIGYLFLSRPVPEELPIADFRTMRDVRINRASPDLLDSIYLCQQRQEWYRDFARSIGDDPLPFVGSLGLDTGIVTAAASMRQALGLDLGKRRRFSTWTDALRDFIEQAEALGILVMVSGIVGSNTHRKLDPDEFRGFALADDLAPLVFINGADTKAGQMFTLAHELAHIWLGVSAVSNAQASSVPEQAIERWCNRVAAELLVPTAALRDQYREHNPLHDEINRLARIFKVSTLVILRSIYDAGYISETQLWDAYQEELRRLQATTKSDGGNFYLTTDARVGKRFARALVASTLEGQTLYRDAFRLLGLSKSETFHELGRRLGVG